MEEEKEVNPSAVAMLDSPKEEKKTKPAKRFPQYFAAISACFGAMSAGTVLAWTSPSLKYLEGLTESEKAGIGSIMAIGALIGSFPSGYLAQRFGRRKTMLMLSGPVLLSWAIIILSTMAWPLLLARILTGFGVGGFCVVIPMYISEIAQDAIRGTLGSYFQLFITIGILYTYILSTFCGYVSLACLSLVVTAVFIIMMYFQPESPTFLIRKRNKVGAKEALIRVRGENFDIDYELNELNKQADSSSDNSKLTFKEIFGSPVFRKALVIAMGLMAVQQLSGINAVIFYAGEIFEKAGSTWTGNACSVVIGVIQMVFAYVVGLVVDRYGRKILLMLSSSVMAISLGALGLYFYLQESQDVSHLGWLPLLSLGLYIIVFSLGFGPIPWMMMAELFPPETKGLASGLAVASNWTLTFLVTLLFPPLSSMIGQAWSFWLFTIFCSLGFLFSKFVVIETKGKSISEIQDILAGKKESSEKNCSNSNNNINV